MNATSYKPSGLTSAALGLTALVSEARHGIERVIVFALAGWDRTRQRRHLLQLDDRLLKDIGLTRADVAREAAKPFWAD